jgi:hypothetical protein
LDGWIGEQKRYTKKYFVQTSVGWFFSFSENCRVWELECFERPDLVLEKQIFSAFKDPGRVSKICKKTFHLGFKALVLRHFIPINFQSWFSHTSYYKFYYLKY